MIRNIGKYEVRERIGRGGMGTVFKAYDPVLARFVAIKLISDEVDVTEELRARFFREAQACAKLSHQNIVTVHEMGEFDGRLYIVMEFLDGEDLRDVIAQRRRLALEDKLALMIQVCSGLQYAHENGVIHRDIKPGNIRVRRDGVAKIVDFGIAYIPTLGGALTRSGLVMGTLRYISPEQARGRADHRSDMFSLGSVFYEFLAYRPALTGAHPMHLLEQLRSEEPTPLTELDASIPADLSAVIAKAMQKEPSARFADLHEMGHELENMQLRLAEEASAVRRRIDEKAERDRRLRAALDERIGQGAAAGDFPVVPTGARLETLLAVERETAERAQRLEWLLGMADAVTPALERGLSQLESGRLSEAIADLELVLAQLPEHERAATALAEARRRVEQRQRQHAVQRLDAARVAFERRAYPVCLHVFAEMRDEAERVGLGEEAAALRRAAEVAIHADEVAQREERHRQRDVAEAALLLMEDARGVARDVDAARLAEALWSSAENRAAVGRADFSREAFVAATEAAEEATALYQRAEEAAWDAIRREELPRERRQADRAQRRVMQQQKAAQVVGAESRADALWGRAARRLNDGQIALGQEAFFRATEAFEEAVALFSQAREAAYEATRKERFDRHRTEAEQARAAAAEARELAEAADVPRRAASVWHAAQARETAAHQAASNAAYGEAATMFREASQLYAEGVRAADAVCRREQTQAEQALQRALESRTLAENALTENLAPTLWAAAEAKASDSQAALTAAHYVVASGHAQEAEALYRRAVQAAETLLRQRRDEAIRSRDLAEQRRDPVEHPPNETGPASQPTRRRALAAGTIAVAFLSVAAGWMLTPRSDTTSPPLKAALSPQSPVPLKAADSVAPVAPIAQEPPTRLASPPSSSPISPEPARLAPNSVNSSSPKPDGFKRSTPEAQRAAEPKERDEVMARKRQEGEDTRSRMLSARRETEQAGAAQYATASTLLASAQGKEREAVSAFSQLDYVAAARLFGEALAQYEAAGLEANKQREFQQLSEKAAAQKAAAEKAAAEKADTLARQRQVEAEARTREAEDAQRRQLALLRSTMDQSRARAMVRREQAIKVNAGRLARDLFEAAEAKLAEGDGQARNQTLDVANRAFQDAADQYIEAGLRARSVGEARIEADAARGRMLAEKQRADQAGQEYAAASAEERQGNVLYEGLTFKEAAEKFRSAEKLFVQSRIARPLTGPAPKRDPGRARPPAPPGTTF